MINSQPFSPLVIDARFAIRAVLPAGTGIELEYFENWLQNRTPLFTPDLCMAEAVSAIRRMVFHRLISLNEGQQAIQDLFSLRLQIVSSDLALYLSAFQWAEQLGESNAYDSLYLALAEKISNETGQTVEVWTADARLANRANQIGAGWVRTISPN
ncbi:MAG: type II toxin-antitoxin system VapC family toxin [Anaerolineales bacterium]